MKTLIRTLNITASYTSLVMVVSIMASAASAAIPHFSRMPAATSRHPALQRTLVLKRSIDFSRGLDAGSIQPIESLRTTNSEDIGQVIPNDMTPTDNGGVVATQILDHSLSNWFNSETVRNSSIGRTAHQVEKSMSGDLAFGGGQPESIRHSLRFSMKATQTRADLEYTGLTNAHLTYFIAQAKTNVEIREEVDLIGTQLVYNHISSSQDTRQMVSARWDW